MSETELDEEKYRQQIVEKVNNSGELLHYRMAGLLKRKGWEVALEQPYLDDATGKVRKCDIIASFSIGSKPYKVILVIECKYIPSSDELILLVDSQHEFSDPIVSVADAIQTRGRELKQCLSGLPNHHYRVNVALLHQYMRLSNEQKQKNEDSFYEAVCQTVKPLLQYKQAGGSYEVFYPMVIVGGKKPYICSADALGKSGGAQVADLAIRDAIPYQLSYVVDKDEPELLLVDVVHESKLEEFLDHVLKSEIDALKKQAQEENNAKVFKEMESKPQRRNLSQSFR